MHIVILTELGITVYEKDVHSYAMPFTNPSKEYLAIKQQESLPIGLAERLAKDQVGFSVTDESLMTLLKKESIDVQMVNEDYLKKVQMEKPKILVESGFASSEKDASEKLRDFAMSLSSSRITKVSSSPDLHVIQSINTLDEVDKVCNALSSRLREWYGLHFPELDNIIDGIVGYSKLVTSGRRDDLNESIFADAGFPESKVSMLKVVQEKSRGGDISDTNLAMVISLAQRMLDMLDLRKNLEDHLEKEMNIVAPNLAVILGTGVAARMLARTGSLKKLASLPASTIQVLGAERALFRSLKTGAPPPKHGILFQHALVHAAPRWQRGKIARAIAAKAVIAARVDVYGNGINPTLMEKLNIRVKEIGTKYDEAPEPRPNQDALDANPEEKRYKDKNDFGKHRKINPENKERNGYGDDLRMERRRKNEKLKYDDSKGERGSRYRGGSKNGYRRDSAHNGFNNRRRDDDSRSGFRSQRNNDRDGFNNRRRDDDSRSGFRSHRNNDRDGFNNRRRDDDSRSGFRSQRNNDRDGFNNRRRDDDSRSGFRSHRNNDRDGFNNRRRDDDSRSGFRSQRNNDRDGFNNRRRDDDSRSGFRSHRNNDRDGFNNRRRDDSRSGFRSQRNNDRDGFNNRRRDDDSRSGFRSHRNNDRDGFNNRRRDDSRSGFREHRNKRYDGRSSGDGKKRGKKKPQKRFDKR